MFGNLMGNMQESQAKMKEELSEIIITEEAGGGAVKIEVNGSKELLNITISPEIVDPEDVEQLEDLLLVALNRAMSRAEAEAEAKMKGMMSTMLPPGLGNLFG